MYESLEVVDKKCAGILYKGNLFNYIFDPAKPAEIEIIGEHDTSHLTYSCRDVHLRNYLNDANDDWEGETIFIGLLTNPMKQRFENMITLIHSFEKALFGSVDSTFYKLTINGGTKNEGKAIGVNPGKNFTYNWIGISILTLMMRATCDIDFSLGITTYSKFFTYAKKLYDADHEKDYKKEFGHLAQSFPLLKKLIGNYTNIFKNTALEHPPVQNGDDSPIGVAELTEFLESDINTDFYDECGWSDGEGDPFDSNALLKFTFGKNVAVKRQTFLSVVFPKPPAKEKETPACLP